MSSISMSSTLTFTAFGPPQLLVNGAPIEIKSRKGLALVAYLAVTRQPAHRDTLGLLLWPDYNQTRARANLRRTLYNLNRTPLADWLHADPETVALHPEALDAADVAQFGNAITADDPDSLRQAVGLYTGEFLADFYLPDSPEFEDWRRLQREAFQRQVLSALQTLSDHELSSGSPDAAETLARRQLEIDNLQEPAWRQLMVALDRQGRRAQALAEYENCRQVLRQEMGVEPDEETVALAVEIRSGKEVQDRPQTTDDGPKTTIVAHPPPSMAGRLPQQPVPSPYRGLFAFREEDAPVFFGREVFTELLLETVEEQSILAVIGPSGSGKSSVVYAGLLPHLRGTRNWITAAFRPGMRPFHSLAATLIPLLEPGLGQTDQMVESNKLASALELGQLSLLDVVDRALQLDGAERLLLVADQFEELYTLCLDGELRHRFLDVVLELVFDQQYRSAPIFSTVLTLRADFLGQVLTHRSMADAIQDVDIKLGPMTRPELQRAVMNPAGLHSTAFEPGLVERILDDVGEEPGNLPLLEFALTSLWERRGQNLLTHSSYETIGRVDGALARYAEEVYAGLTAEEQVAARRIFIQLVRPGEGTEDTRRIAARSELGEPDWDMVQGLADARLVVTGRGTGPDEHREQTVEVVHEALIRSWERLRGWMEEDRTFRIWQERLRAAHGAWQASGQDEGGLLRGVSLNTAEDWLETRSQELSGPEREFVDASVALRQSRAERERKQQQERERLRQRVSQVLAAGFLIAMVLALAAAFQWNRAQQNAQTALDEAEKYATSEAKALDETKKLATSEAQAVDLQATAETERDVAEEQARFALARQLASQSSRLISTGQLNDGLLLAIEGARTAELPETWLALRAAVTEPRSALLFLSVEGLLSAVWSSDEQLIITGGATGQVRVWDARTGTLRHALAGHNAPVSVYPSHLSNRVLSADLDGTVRVWDAATGDNLLAFRAHPQELLGAIWSQDDAQFATAGTGDAGGFVAKIWDSQTGALLLQLVGHEGRFRPQDWSQDGSRLLTSGIDGTARIWDATSGEELMQLAEHPGGTYQASWSQDEARIVTAGVDGSAAVWDAQTGERLRTLSGDGRPRLVAVFNDDASQVLTAGASGTVQIWNAATGANLLTLAGHSGVVLAAAWNRDQSHFLSASLDGSLRVWDAQTGGETAVFRHRFRVPAAFWSADGNRILSVSAREGVHIWQINPTEPSPELPALQMSPYDVFHIQASADGQHLLTASRDPEIGFVHIWDAASGASVVAMKDIVSISSVAVWNRDESRVLAGSRSGLVGVWRADNGDQIFRAQAHTGLVSHVAWRPDEREILSAGTDATVRVWDANSGEQRLTLAHDAALRWVAWSKDGKRIFSGDESTKEPGYMWDAATGTLLFRLQDSGGPLLDGQWSLDGNRLLTAGADGNATVWDGATGERMVVLFAHPGGVRNASWSRDGNRLLTGGADAMARVWDATTGQLLLELGGHTGAISSSAWSTDEAQIATFSNEDGTVRLWNAETGELVMIIERKGITHQILWSTDGRQLLVAGSDGVGRFYTVLDDLLTEACRRVEGNFAQDEWRQFFGGVPFRQTCPEE